MTERPSIPIGGPCKTFGPEASLLAGHAHGEGHPVVPFFSTTADPPPSLLLVDTWLTTGHAREIHEPDEAGGTLDLMPGRREGEPERRLILVAPIPGQFGAAVPARGRIDRSGLCVPDQNAGALLLHDGIPRGARLKQVRSPHGVVLHVRTDALQKEAAEDKPGVLAFLGFEHEEVLIAPPRMERVVHLGRRHRLVYGGLVQVKGEAQVVMGGDGILPAEDPLEMDGSEPDGRTRMSEVDGTFKPTQGPLDSSLIIGVIIGVLPGIPTGSIVQVVVQVV